MRVLGNPVFLAFSLLCPRSTSTPHVGQQFHSTLRSQRPEILSHARTGFRQPGGGFQSPVRTDEYLQSGKRIPLFRQIEKLEHTGDEITHQIFNETSKTFITPFDREDLQRLASGLDDVLDYIHGSAKRIELYKVETMHPSMVKLAELIMSCSNELYNAISGLRSMKNQMKVREALVRVNSIENHADDIFDNAVARLFEDEKTPFRSSR